MHKSVFLEIINFLAACFSWRSIAALAGAVIIATTTGFVLHGTPSYELSYAKAVIPGGCSADGCLQIVVINVGNTGEHCLNSWQIEFNSEAQTQALMPPQFARFGKIPVPATPTTKDDSSSYELGELCPTQRVDIRMVFRTADRSDFSWDWLHMHLSAPRAKVVEQSPETTRFARFLYQLAATFL